MKHIYLSLFISNLAFSQPKDTQETQQAVTYKSHEVFYNTPINSIPADPDQVSAAPPPPVETPIYGTELLLVFGLILGIPNFLKKVYRMSILEILRKEIKG